MGNETYDEVSAMDKVDINATYDEIPATENVDLNGSCRETIERKKKKSGLKEWDKRTGAKIYHMTENISEKGLNVVRSVSRSRSREPSPSPVYRESENGVGVDPNQTYDEISDK